MLQLTNQLTLRKVNIQDLEDFEKGRQGSCILTSKVYQRLKLGVVELYFSIILYSIGHMRYEYDLVFDWTEVEFFECLDE
jgi:hypothetical protein